MSETAMTEQEALMEWYITHGDRCVNWRTAELEFANKKSTQLLKERGLLEGQKVDGEWCFKLTNLAIELLKTSAPSN